jgi:5-methyltetrahydropteroyltriglutamate--homocysteine methyltransferase
MNQKVLQTTVVGSYPRLDYVVKAVSKYKSKKLTKAELKKITDKATREVVEEQIKAGIDIIADGEQYREDMEVYFAERIEGFREGDWIRIWGNNYYRKPIISKKVKFIKPMTLDDFLLARKTAARRAEVKQMYTGPYTIADWAFNEAYKNKADLVMELAKILHKETKLLEKAGCPYIQIDEPALSTHNSKDELEMARQAIEIVTKGVKAKTAIHICYGDFEQIFPAILDFNIDLIDLEFANNKFRTLDIIKKYDYQKELGFGCVDVHIKRVETKEEVKENIQKALDILPPERIYPKPDCGLKLLPRDIAYQKLCVITEAVKELREEL